MRLSSLNKYFLSLFCFLVLNTAVYAEDTVDIWKKNKLEKRNELKTKEKNITDNKIDLINKKSLNSAIDIQNEISSSTAETNLFGIYDPDENNFDLNMWAASDGGNVRNIIKRINNLNLSVTAENIFLTTMMSYSYLPKNISDEEFLDIKIDWLIENKKGNVLEKFLEKNLEFHNKKKVIQYLVDSNIANANLKLGCEKASFISKEIKDPYLEKFKIYCLVYNNKKNQAQLLYDILKEQNQSDKFFDDKINFLLGISEKMNTGIKDDNLLNFYLSSVTVKDFKYEPTAKTKKSIWEYLNSADLITIDNVEDKKKIGDLELAANENRLEKNKIFDIYKKFQFDLDTLVEAKESLRKLDNIESRALIYQKYLLSDNDENKLELLFLLKDLFKKDNLSNVYTKFLSDRLKNLMRKRYPILIKMSLKDILFQIQILN